MKIQGQITILLLYLGAGSALRHRLKGDTTSNARLPTSSPTMKPTKVDLKVGKEKGKHPNNDELTEVPTSAPSSLESKDDTKGKKTYQPFSSPTIQPTIPSFQLDPSVLTPPPTPSKFDPKSPIDKNDDTKESPSPSPMKDPKGSTTPKGAPEDLDANDNTGLGPTSSATVEATEPEPKGDPKASGTEDDTEPKGVPKGSTVVDGAVTEAKGSSIVEDSEPEAKGAPKASEIDEDSDPDPKGAPKGSGATDGASPDQKGAPTGLGPKGDPKGFDGNVFDPSTPTKKASPPVEVHMIGVKLGSRKNKNNAATVSTVAGCSQAGNNMIAKKIKFSSACTQDPADCGLAGGTKKNKGKRNLKKSSCGMSNAKKRYT